MSMGRREERQAPMWLAGTELARSPGHRFYEKLNELLSEAKFDTRVEQLCAPYFEALDKPGRPSIPPGVYFRMLFVGYFEGIESERGLEWRCADSLSLRMFLGLQVQERVPDHSSLSRMRTLPRRRGLRRGVPTGTGDRGSEGAAAGQGRGRGFDVPARREGRKPKADPMAKRTPGIPGPSACHEPFGT